MTPACPEHWTNRFPNLVILRLGDVVRALGGYCAVLQVNECNARVLPLGEPEKVTITTRFGRQWQVTERAKAEPIAAELPPEAVVERRGAAWLEQFLKAVAPRREVRPVDGAETTTTDNDNERNESMPRTNKSATQPRDRRKDRGGLAAENAEVKKANADGTRQGGKLGELFGHSVTSVMRTLGREGCSVARVKAIMVAKKVDAAPATCQLQTNAGKNGKTAGRDGKPVTYADLDKAQLKELLDAAPEPEKAAAK